MTSRFNPPDNWITNDKIWNTYMEFCTDVAKALGDVAEERLQAIMLYGDGVEATAQILGLSEDTVRNVVRDLLDPTWSRVYETLIFPLERAFESEETFDTNTTNYVYLMHDPISGYYKIGRSIDPDDRLRGINNIVPPGTEVKLIHKFPASNADHAESLLHEIFKHKNVKLEWFDLNEKNVEFITEIVEYSSEGFFCIENEFGKSRIYH